jgi:hypothetical protein
VSETLRTRVAHVNRLSKDGAYEKARRDCASSDASFRYQKNGPGMPFDRQFPGRPAAGARPASRGARGALVRSPAALALVHWGRDVSLGKDSTTSLRRRDYDGARLATHVVTSALPGESHFVYACCVSSSGQAGTRWLSEFTHCLDRVFPLRSRHARGVNDPRVKPRR